MGKNNFASIESIISVAKKGGMFILVDDEKRENEGDLVISTSDSNAKNINFMAKYGRGLICLALDTLQAKRLNLSLMSPVNQSRNKTAFTISIEAKKGITTGISAKDRARTIKIASKKKANKNEIVSPGHVFPIIAKDGGVLVRAGHTEASVDISKLAKKNNSAVICEIMNEDGTMAKGKDLINFAKKHKLKIGKIEDLIAYRLKKEKLIKLKKQSKIDVKNQKYNIRIYENLLDGSEHFALIKGKIKKGITPRVRVISSNVVQNYLINQSLPNSFNKRYFKYSNDVTWIFCPTIYTFRTNQSNFFCYTYNCSCLKCNFFERKNLFNSYWCFANRSSWSLCYFEARYCSNKCRCIFGFMFLFYLVSSCHNYKICSKS